MITKLYIGDFFFCDISNGGFNHLARVSAKSIGFRSNDCAIDTDCFKLLRGGILIGVLIKNQPAEAGWR